MTEDEARKRWCPMAQVPIQHAHTNNSVVVNMSDNTPLAHCIASECMMWRWHQVKFNETDEGHCGLAGQI